MEMLKQGKGTAEYLLPLGDWFSFSLSFFLSIFLPLSLSLSLALLTCLPRSLAFLTLLAWLAYSTVFTYLLGRLLIQSQAFGTV